MGNKRLSWPLHGVNWPSNGIRTLAPVDNKYLSPPNSSFTQLLRYLARPCTLKSYTSMWRGEFKSHWSTENNRHPDTQTSEYIGWSIPMRGMATQLFHLSHPISD